VGFVPYPSIFNSSEGGRESLFYMPQRRRHGGNRIVRHMEILHTHRITGRRLTGIIDGDAETEGECIGSALQGKMASRGLAAGLLQLLIWPYNLL
jgi:hypothetical protein